MMPRVDNGSVKQIAQIGRGAEGDAPQEQRAQRKTARAINAIERCRDHSEESAEEKEKTLGLGVEVQIVLLLVKHGGSKAGRASKTGP